MRLAASVRPVVSAKSATMLQHRRATPTSLRSASKIPSTLNSKANSVTSVPRATVQSLTVTAETVAVVAAEMVGAQMVAAQAVVVIADQSMT
ncbi:MAG: hypothetical protein ACJA14_002276 [Ilumatobacter sp.]|jgi:hypothetical protein